MLSLFCLLLFILSLNNVFNTVTVDEEYNFSTLVHAVGIILGENRVFSIAAKVFVFF